MAKAKTEDLDLLIAEAVKPKCPAVIHRLPEEGQRMLRRAREVVDAGESLSATTLARIIKREWAIHVDDKSVSRYLRSGCSCDA